MNSLGSYLHYIIFVDDFPYKSWIFFLKHKDQAFDMFKDFKVLIENQTRKRTKAFRVDK